MTMRRCAISSLVLPFLLLSACGQDAPPPPRTIDCVVLLHGLARTSLSMVRMKFMLENEGYLVANIDYPSRDHKIEVLAPMAVEAGLQECAAQADYRKVHFVTHSLGGILVRAYYAEHEHGRLGRVVMLGPPNQGSQAVDQMDQLPGFDWMNGPAGYQLGKGAESVPLALGPPDFEFAVIAGDRTIDPITSAVLDDPDDGKVSVADTRLEGMRDFVVLPVSHAMMMQDSDVFERVRDFLAHGSFAAGVGSTAE
jgi:pimeloyl-ACP methyl ester carboxylesterase